MSKLQEIFDEIQEKKRDRREINKEYRDLLIQSERYQEIKEEMQKLKEKKGLVETEAKNEMGSRWDQLEKLKTEVENLEQLLTDTAMTQLMKGENIDIIDKNEVKYEPIYHIVFKKTN